MRTLFSNSPILDCDCFVADYSELTNDERKVEISLEPFSDIAYFHFHKRRKTDQIPYLAVNLEQYPHFIKDSKNCECIFKSLGKEGNSWIMFLELKYCKEEKTESYSYTAFTQMHDTLTKIEAAKCLDRKDHNIYFVYAVPEHPEKQPFGAWTISQNDTLKAIEAGGIHLLGVCKMLIATPRYLFPPKIKE